ncbi:transposase [Effusibacillus lacus]|uniref:Transposase n=1 Tax=Effusibacillus lacus TaxID=1348429 RepID=A0A292YHN4_9BACL|nr:transposase [Effusibacillus lacus]
MDSITYLDAEQDEPTGEDYGQLSFHELKADPGRPGLESVLKEVNKLANHSQLGASG